MVPLWSLAVHAGSLAALAADPFSLPATVVTLDNGLTVLLLEDHRTDTVALHISYGVGSRDEGPAEAGCAHLFEHLMFEGSRGVPGDKFDTWLTAAGGDNNAWTSEDETAYHMTFPSGALDLALFLESDRLGFLDAGLVPENLANQQHVVLQERAEGYAEPNGRDQDSLSRILWPEGHPYHRPVIGTVADIEGFSLDATRSFWESHYRTRNAVLALVGNFDTATATERVKHWFSDVPDRGPALDRQPAPVAGGGTGKVAGVVEDDVEERTVYLAWETVDERHADAPALDVLGAVLSNGQGTRLDDAVYYGSQLASSVGAYAYAEDVAGQFVVYASSPDTPLPKLVGKLNKQLDKIAAAPPTADELARAKRALRAYLLDGIERPADKASQLATCWRWTGAADCLAAEWARYDAVTAADVTRVAAKYLSGPPTTLSNVPRGDAASAVPGADGSPAVAVELP
ncbi:MAG: pitrilysin family protein [Myxococcota bacterium]